MQGLVSGDFCHQGRDTEIAQTFKIVAPYWHDHSLESSSDALSDGTISFSIHQLPGEICFFWIFLKNTPVLNELITFKLEIIDCLH
jgi:hypothetical protein